MDVETGDSFPEEVCFNKQPIFLFQIIYQPLRTDTRGDCKVIGISRRHTRVCGSQHKKGSQRDHWQMMQYQRWMVPTNSKSLEKKEMDKFLDETHKEKRW